MQLFKRLQLDSAADQHSRVLVCGNTDSPRERIGELDMYTVNKRLTHMIHYHWRGKITKKLRT